MIDKRPKIVDKKSRIGDLEIDTVIGKNHIGALVTVVDRKSKFSMIRNVSSKEARIVTQALIEMIQQSNYSHNHKLSQRSSSCT